MKNLQYILCIIYTTSFGGLTAQGPASPVARTAAVTTCTDMINFAGNTVGKTFELGGNVTRILQSFGRYHGKVLGVQFEASKSPSSSVNPVISVQVYDNNVSPDVGTPLGSAVTLTITSATPSVYTVMFPSPVTITQSSDEFAIGIGAVGTNHKTRIDFGPTIPGQTNSYSWLTTAGGGTYPYLLSNYYNLQAAIDALIRPIVTTSVDASWNVSKTSDACTLPAQYIFIPNGQEPPSYSSYTRTCPGGITEEAEYGDNSAIVPISGSASHAYTSAGTYTAIYRQIYNGWTSNCVSTATALISLDVPKADFTWLVSGSTVMFVNLSSGVSGTAWYFGDGGSSSVTDPTHQYGAISVYDVTLSCSSPCGTVTTVRRVDLTPNAIAEQQAEMVFYPNPVRDALHTGAGDKTGRIEIYDQQGARVRDLPAAAVIDLSDLPAGVFNLRYISSGKAVSKRIVKE